MDIYIYAKKKGFLVELFTNGALLNDEIIKLLAEYPPLLVDISLYGANEKTYELVTGVTGAFDKVINNCKKLHNAGIRVSLKTPVIKATFNELEDMKRIAEDLRIKFVYTFEICPTIDKDESPTTQQISLKEVLKNEFNNYYEQVSNGDRKAGELNLNEINNLNKCEMVFSCNVAQNSFVVDYNGNICPCMKLRHKGVKLTADSYDAVWSEFSKYSKMKASDNYKCKGCKSRYYCDICPAEMDLLYANVEYRNDKMCRPANIRKDFYEGKVTFEEALDMASFNE